MEVVTPNIQFAQVTGLASKYAHINSPNISRASHTHNTLNNVQIKILGVIPTTKYYRIMRTWWRGECTRKSVDKLPTAYTGPSRSFSEIWIHKINILFP